MSSPALTSTAGNAAAAAPRRRTPRSIGARALDTWAVRWISPLAILAIWQIASATGLLSTETLPAPSDVLNTAWGLITDGQLPDALAVSLRRAARGFGLGVAAALVFGTIAGLSKIGDALVDPPMQMV